MQIHRISLLLACAVLSLLATSSCKDDDKKEEVTYSNCCSPRYLDSTASFTLHLANAYTPDGDGLNDEYNVWAHDSMGVQFIVDFKVYQNGQPVVSMDTLFSSLSGTNISWNIRDSSDHYIYGTLPVSFVVVDTANKATSISSSFCSFDRVSLPPYNSINWNYCVFNDQLVPGKGFVQPTSEKLN